MDMSKPRKQTWTFDLLDNLDRKIGTLDGVESGRFDASQYARIRTSGQISYSGASEVDWSTVRIRPIYTMETSEGAASWPLGIFIPSTPEARWNGAHVSYDVELYDKLVILDRDELPDSFAVDSGESVADAVRFLVSQSAGQQPIVEDSGALLSVGMAWDAGTPTLTVVNELLEAGGFFALWCDHEGAFRSSPYRDPSSRPVEYNFTDGEASIYTPELSHERDFFDTPNRVILVSTSDGETPAYRSVATNDDPRSPFSTVSRGRVITSTDTNVDASSQAVLDSIAQRRLANYAQVASVVTMKHALLDIQPGAVVQFTHSLSGLSIRGTVEKLSFSTAQPCLCESTIREVLS